MKNRRGFALLMIVIALLVIGILYVYMSRSGTGAHRAAPSPDAPYDPTSQPKQIIDKAKAAAGKANKRQADSDQQLKDLGLQ